MRVLVTMAAVSAVAVLLNAGDAEGARLNGAVRDVAVIQDGAGSARILFRAAPEISGLSEAIISKAQLTVTTTGTADTRSLRVRVYPVTTRGWSAAGASWSTGWSRPGGDYDEELFASAELDFTRGGATATFDVTGILKEVLESGMTGDGFLLTVDPVDGTGIPVADLTRFGTLSGASLDVSYRQLPAGLLSREGSASR